MGTAATVGKAKIWLVRGDEPRLVSDHETELIAQLAGGAPTDVVVFDGDDAVGTDICAALEQNHMFSDAAIVCLRQADHASEDLADVVASFLAGDGVADGLANFFIVSHIGGRLSTKLAKVLAQVGTVADLRMTKPDERAKFLAGEFASTSLGFSPGAKRRIAEHFGEDVARVRALVEILEARYGDSAAIDEEMVEPYLSRAGSQPLYELTNAIEAARPGGEGAVLNLLERFLGDMRIHPLVILTVITRRMVEIVAVQDPSLRSADQVNVRLEAFGMKKKAPFAAKKLLEAAQSFSYADGLKALTWCAEAEGRAKGMEPVPEEFAVQLLVARLANLFARRRRSH